MPTPELVQVLREAADARVALVHTGTPGKIVAYDHTTQKATVQPIPRGAYRDDDGEVRRYDFPAIANVPVMFPSASGYAITFPITIGDHGWLEFGERSIDEWLATGEGTTEPLDLRRHDLSDAVFYPGTRSFANAIAAAGIDVAALVVEGANIKLGSSAATLAVALNDQVLADLNALKLAVAAAVIAPGDGGASLKAAIAGWTPSAAGATKVKAE